MSKQTNKINTVAILGAGKMGTTVARLAAAAGVDVFIAGSGDPSEIQLTVGALAPEAKPTESRDAVRRSDATVLAIPLGEYRTLPQDALGDGLVIDAMNYWWETDGRRSQFEDPQISTSEIIADFLDNPRVVKALSHMSYHDLDDNAQPDTLKGRKAMALAGDDKSAVSAVADLVDWLGFDPLLIGPLAQGVRLEPGGRAFGASVEAEKLQEFVDQFDQTDKGQAVRAARPELF